jgi:tape measure domain-containing protein
MSKEKVEIILEGEFKNGKVVIDNLKNIDKNLNNVGKQAKKSTKEVNILSNSLKRLATIVGVGILARKFTDLAKNIFLTTARFEQYQIALSSIIKSQKIAGDLLRDLIEFGKKTPFEIEGLVRSSKLLLGIGFEVKNIIPILDMLGNIAAGVGVPVERLAVVFGQVRTATRLMAQDANQFIQAGVPIYNALSETLGKTTREIKKMQEQGLISFNDVARALQSLTNEGGQFHRLMIEQSKSFLGVVSNIKDAWTDVKNTLGSVLLPTAKKVALAIFDYFENLRKKITANQDKIQEFTNSLINALKKIGQGFIQVYNYGVLPFVKGVKILISLTLVKWVLAGAVAIKTLRISVSLLNATLRATTKTKIILIFTLLTGVLGKLYEKFEIVRRSVLELEKIFLRFKKSTVDALTKSFSALSNVMEKIGFGNVEKGFEKISEKTNQWSANTISQIDKVNEKIKNIGKEEKPIEKEVITKEPGELDFKTTTGELILEPEPPPSQKDIEKDRLKQLKEEHEALLNEKRRFFKHSEELQTDANQLEFENDIIRLENKLLNNQIEVDQKNKANEDYKASIDQLNQDLINGQITFQEYQFELEEEQINLRRDALDSWLEETLNKETLNNDEKINAKIKYYGELDKLDKKNKELNKKREGAQNEELSKIEKIFQNEKFKSAQEGFNQLTQLSNSKHKELAAIGKAANMVQITMDTATGAMSAYKAMASIPVVGPSLGVAAAAAVVAYGAEQLAKVKGSFAEGTPRLPDDSVIQAHKNEMIVPATFAESIRRGELSLVGNNTANENNAVGTNNIVNINFDNTNFYGDFNDDMIEDISRKMSQLINENIIEPITTRNQ